MNRSIRDGRLWGNALRGRRGLHGRIGPILGLLVAFATIVGCASTPTPPEEELAGPPPPPPTFPDRLPTEPGPIPAGVTENRDPYAPGVDVHHYEVELALSDTENRIWGRTGIDVTLTEESGGDLTLDFTGLAIWAITVDGHERPFDYRTGRVTVQADTGRHLVEVRYLGTPDDGLIIRDNVHGDPSVFADNWPNRARFWFPSVDDPSDKATVRFEVHAPTRWEVIANGSLQADPFRTSPNTLTALGYLGDIGHQTWIWTTSVRIPVATMVVGAADFAIHTVGQAACGNAPVAPDSCVDVTVWSFPEDSTTAAHQFRRSAEMVDYFTDLIGPFPYEKLANVQSATRFGGMENSSAIFYSEQAIAQGRDIEGTVSHEIAHQWFGDGVTETKWSHLWLSEGFATYFGSLFFEHADGVENFRERMRSSRARVLASQVVFSTPVIDEDETNLYALLNDNNYPKGGWILHMLRRRMGDDAFFRGIRRFYAEFEHGTALTDDFRASMEQVAGESLEAFFDQWLNHPGFPELDVAWVWSAERGGVEITVNQVQDEAWPVFSEPVDLEFRVGDSLIRHTVDLTGRSTASFLALDGEPEALTVDPDAWLLAKVHETTTGR